MSNADRRTKRRSRPAVLGLLLLAVTACGDLPRDPEETLETVRAGTLRVGVIHAPPWTRVEGGGEGEEVGGIEAEMVRELARGLGAEVEWHPGGAGEVMEALERFQLDLVVGGLDHRSPWKKRVALTSPYLISRLTVGNPPGRNPPDELESLRVAVEPGSAAAALVEAKEGRPVEMADLQKADFTVAAEDWQLAAWGRRPADLELAKVKRVWAVPPGENAWLRHVDLFLHPYRDRPPRDPAAAPSPEPETVPSPVRETAPAAAPPEA